MKASGISRTSQEREKAAPTAESLGVGGGVGSLFPSQGSNLQPLQWKHAVLTTGPPGESLTFFNIGLLPLTKASHTNR